MQRPVVLIVAEHEDSRIIVRTIAAYAGLDAIEAADGRRGIELAAEHVPALIVLDLDMTRLSGFDVLTVLRTNLSLASVPVIAMSANPVDQEAGAAGFDAFVSKPIGIQAMALELLRLSRPLDA